MTEDIQRTQLANGVRIVTERVTSVASIALGIWVATGSRHEAPHQRGVSHFLEHMLFKGTERRPSAKIISDEMDAVGGYLDAFTSKEYTAYTARALSEHLPLAHDLLSDLLAHALLEPTEMERERGVILEEIKERDDAPDDLVHDLIAETLWPDHPLGLPVIGNTEIVGNLTAADLREYQRARCTPDQIIVAAAGDLTHQMVVELTEKALGTLRGTAESLPLFAPRARAGRFEFPRPTEQVNFCVATAGVGYMDTDRYPLTILDTVLGGSMGSRLFQEIREKRGLAYSVGTYAALHAEGGMFVAYGATSPQTYELCLELCADEFERIQQDGILPDELARAKNQIRGGTLLAQESLTARMERLGKSELYYQRVPPLGEGLAKIERVTAEDVRRAAQRLFPGRHEMTVAAVGPFRKTRRGSGSRSAAPTKKHAGAKSGAKH